MNNNKYHEQIKPQFPREIWNDIMDIVYNDTEMSTKIKIVTNLWNRVDSQVTRTSRSMKNQESELLDKYILH